MSGSEVLFVIGCILVVFAMIGPVSLAAGVVCALFVGLLVWAVFILLPNGDEDWRRR